MCRCTMVFVCVCVCVCVCVWGGWVGGWGRVLTVGYPAYAVVPPGFALVPWVAMAEAPPPRLSCHSP